MSTKRFKKRIIIKKNNIYIFILILIGINAFLIIRNINYKVTPKLLEISNDKIYEIITDIINESYSKQILEDLSSKEIIIVRNSKNNEIVSADFDLENAYVVLRKAISMFQKSINDLEKGKYIINDYDEVYLDKSDNGFIFNIPIGLATDKIFLSSFGPKIPVKLDFLGSALGSIKTNITDYGINNSLIEVFFNIEIVFKIILPVKSNKQSINHDILLSSKVIQGKVPTFYNGSLKNTSKLIDIPLD